MTDPAALHFGRATADDALGAQRERNVTPLPPAYRTAFDAIDRDPNYEIVVAVDAASA